MTRLDHYLKSETFLPVAGIAAIWRDGVEAIAALPLWERGFTVFWLLGPFILLVERSPADAWISILMLAFVIRSIIRRDGGWLKHFWVRAGFAFWIWCIIAGAISHHPVYAATEAAIWFRFPLFAMATVFWLGRDRRLLYLMYLATTLGLLIMCGILIAELLIEGQKGGSRLTWPYGDLVPGGYLAKTGLPVLAAVCAIAVGLRDRIALLAAGFALVVVFVSLMAGERIHFLIVICGGVLAALLWRPRLLHMIYLGIAGWVVMIIGIILSADTAIRFTSNFVAGVTDLKNSVWFDTLRNGWLTAQDNWLLGIGTANYRLDYPALLEARGISVQHLDPHPHNFYLQIWAETGVIGLVLGTTFLWSTVLLCIRGWLSRRDNVLVATAFVVPYAFFWPIATTGDFFGQWGNCFLWSGVALALAACNMKDKETGE
jgi:O-antigen ligase